MKAEVYLVDENGIRMSEKPTLINPVGVECIGITTRYTFAFEFSKLNKDAFDELAEEVRNKY